MKKKLYVLIGFCFCLSMFLNSTGLSYLEKLKLISDNVEALTKDYEKKEIDSEWCYGVELGTAIPLSTLREMNPDIMLFKFYFSSKSDDGQYFYEFASQRLELLPKCNVYNYGYGAGIGSYCWIEGSNVLSGSIRVGDYLD